MATQSVIPMAVRPMGRSDLPPEIQEILKRPLPAEAIGKHPKIDGLSSIKAAFVIEQLNEAFGVGGWDDHAVILERTTREDIWNAGKANEKKVVMHVATVQLFLTVEKYGLHKDNFGGSDNVDLGDALKGARTDALTKIASELGIGLEVYKSGREAKGDELPACPGCEKTGTIIKGKQEYGGGYVCYTKKSGCGAKFTDAEMEQIKAGKTEPAAKPPQSAQQPAATSGNVGKFPLKGIVTDRHTERKDGNNVFWLTLGERECATKQPEIMNQLAKAFKGSQVEMLVTKLSGEKGDIFQIREVIRVTPPQEGGRN